MITGDVVFCGGYYSKHGLYIQQIFFYTWIGMTAMFFPAHALLPRASIGNTASTFPSRTP